MDDRADICRQRENRTARNTLPELAGRVEQVNGTGRERDAARIPRGRTRLESSDGEAQVANCDAEKAAGDSAAASEKLGKSGSGAIGAAVDLARIPEGVRASVASKPGEYDARRLRSQREIIRDVMISAADCETWLTLGELRALTRYGEASISAQLRHLRKMENGGYDVIKRHRDGVSPERPGSDGRGECVWEYRIERGMCGHEKCGRNAGGLDAAA